MGGKKRSQEDASGRGPPGSQTQVCGEQGAAFCHDALTSPRETKNTSTGSGLLMQGTRGLWGPTGYSSKFSWGGEKEDRATCPAAALSRLPEPAPQMDELQSGMFPAAAVARWAPTPGLTPCLLLAQLQRPSNSKGLQVSAGALTLEGGCPRATLSFLRLHRGNTALPRRRGPPGVDRKPKRHHGRAQRQGPVSPVPITPLRGPVRPKESSRHPEPGSGHAPHHLLGTGL